MASWVLVIAYVVIGIAWARHFVGWQVREGEVADSMDLLLVAVIGLLAGIVWPVLLIAIFVVWPARSVMNGDRNG